MTTEIQLQLTSVEGVELAHAMVAHTARSLDIRVLFIKGPLLNIQNLRTPRPSSDVDVLVDPVRRNDLVNSLESFGWRRRPDFGGGYLLPLHAISLIHDSWPCDIDVHDRYPGFFAEPAVIFETLLARATTVTLASYEIPCCDRVGNSLIVAAHALRQPTRLRSQQEIAFIVEKVKTNFSDDERAAIVHVASTLRGFETLHPFLSQVDFADQEKDLTSQERQIWAMVIADESRSLGWIMELKRSTWRGRVGVIFRAVHPTEEQLRAIRPQTKPGIWALQRARWSRLVRGPRSMYRAVRSYATQRPRDQKL